LALEIIRLRLRQALRDGKGGLIARQRFAQAAEHKAGIPDPFQHDGQFTLHVVVIWQFCEQGIELPSRSQIALACGGNGTACFIMLTAFDKDRGPVALGDGVDRLLVSKRRAG
jgi:hypothetical protein